jgi:hypothetical protein
MLMKTFLIVIVLGYIAHAAAAGTDELCNMSGAVEAKTLPSLTVCSICPQNTMELRRLASSSVSLMASRQSTKWLSHM